MLNSEQLQLKWLSIAAQIFETAGHAPLYLVGGFVRDMLLGRPSNDVDLAVPGSPAGIIATTRRFANAINATQDAWRATFLTLDPENGVTRVVFQLRAELIYFDFAAFNTAPTIEADLARRDFTVNALAVPLSIFLATHGQIQNEAVLDVSGGLGDLQAGIVRAVSAQNLIDDPLRLLRGVRLKAQLSKSARIWQIDPATESLFHTHAALIGQPAAERVREELNKILMAADTERNLRLLDTTGLLTRLIPELEEGRGCIQMPGHYYDVFDHTLTAVGRCEWLTTPPEDFFGLGREVMQDADRPEKISGLWSTILEDLEAEAKANLLTLRWATLLHDVGKPRTKTIDDTGHIHFYEHNRVGAEMAQVILQRLRFSNILIEQVGLMVHNHLRIGQLGENFDTQDYSGISDRAAFRFLRDTAPIQAAMLVLSLADHAAVDGPRMLNPANRYGWWRHLVITDFFARKFLGTEPERVMGKPRLLDGKILMQELKLPPGPKIGYLLRQIEEAQAASEITSTAQALELAQKLLQE